MDARWDEHGFVAWQDCLAERDNTASVVRYANGTRAWLAVRLVREGLAYFAVLIAIQTTILTWSACISVRTGYTGTYHGLRICVRCGRRIPLHRQLAWWTRVWAVIPWKTGLIRAHGPSRILRSWCDWDQTHIGRKLTLSPSSLNGGILRRGFQRRRSQLNSTLSALSRRK